MPPATPQALARPPFPALSARMSWRRSGPAPASAKPAWPGAARLRKGSLGSRLAFRPSFPDRPRPRAFAGLWAAPRRGRAGKSSLIRLKCQSDVGTTGSSERTVRPVWFVLQRASRVWNCEPRSAGRRASSWGLGHSHLEGFRDGESGTQGGAGPPKGSEPGLGKPRRGRWEGLQARKAACCSSGHIPSVAFFPTRVQTSGTL